MSTDHTSSGREYILLADWIDENYESQSVIDVGGGSGLLTYLLIQRGFDAAVLDPVFEPLPEYYFSIKGEKVNIPSDTVVPYIDREFSPQVAESFDLVIGLHAHEVNLEIVEATAKASNNFIIIPCCYGNEPIDLGQNADWFGFLLERAEKLGHSVSTFELPFKGKNKGIYSLN